MKLRVKLAKESTVRVFVNNQPSGSGFVVSSSGLVLTCFHVVESMQPAPNGQTVVSYAKTIEVEFPGGVRVPTTVHASCQNAGFLAAISHDYCLLETQTARTSFLKLGSLASVSEGDPIYLCGYPMGIAQPVVATGMLSTKWAAPVYIGNGPSRSVAWLDITMNKGNSGGPIIRITDDPANDNVIGIATFGLNPFAQPAETLVQVVQAFPGNVVIMGVDFKQFGTLIGSALASTSIGVNGCVDIDYARKVLP